MKKLLQSATIPSGVWPVMLTPFVRGEEIDFAALDRLIDWYIGQGVHGLFSACLSSETLQIRSKAKRELVRHVLNHVDGRVPVVAGVMGFGSRQERVEVAQEALEHGAHAAVFTLCDIVPAAVSDEGWIEEMEAHLDLLGEVPLGVYECPWPYHRVLTPTLTQYVAGRPEFLFLKETTGKLPEMVRKRTTCAATGLKVFSADAVTLYEALQAGIDGFSGLQSNLWPGLFVKLFETWKTDPQLAERLQKFFIDYNWAVSRSYPASAKRYLSTAHGIPMKDLSYLNNASLKADDQQWIDSLVADAAEFSKSIDLLGQHQH